MKIYDYNGSKNICGDRVHEARRKMKLTQSELAAKLQVAGIEIERDSISRIEIGTRFVADYELRELAKERGLTCISSPLPLNSVRISLDKNLELLPVIYTSKFLI